MMFARAGILEGTEMGAGNLRLRGSGIGSRQEGNFRGVITHTQEPSDHNGTPVQLRELKVVDSLSCCQVHD